MDLFLSAKKIWFDIPGFSSTKYLTKLVKFLAIRSFARTDICLVYKLKNKNKINLSRFIKQYKSIRI